MQTYSLRSMEHPEILNGDRVCDFLEKTRFDTGKNAMWCHVSPGIIVQNLLGWQPDRHLVLLTARFQGDDILEFPNNPMYVHVAIPKLESQVRAHSVVTASDFPATLRAELHRVEQCQ